MRNKLHMKTNVLLFGLLRIKAKKPRFKNRFLVFFRFLGFRFLKFFLGFNLQMPDTKLRATSTMKSKDKSSEQRFGHVNATNPNSHLNIIFIDLATQ